MQEMFENEIEEGIMAFDIHDADDEEYWDGWDDDDRDYPDPEADWEDCSCPYCFCLNKTEYGEICSDCRDGAHQG